MIEFSKEHSVLNCVKNNLFKILIKYDSLSLKVKKAEHLKFGIETV